jgi:hypothetical protein
LRNRQRKRAEKTDREDEPLVCYHGHLPCRLTDAEKVRQLRSRIA